MSESARPPIGAEEGCHLCLDIRSVLNYTPQSWPMGPPQRASVRVDSEPGEPERWVAAIEPKTEAERVLVDLVATTDLRGAPPGIRARLARVLKSPSATSEGER